MIGLGYESIHACEHDCCFLLGDDNKDLDLCPVCNTSRWKDSNTSGKKVHKKVLRYFLIIPRLQRLYKSSHTTKEMIWHATGKCTKPGKMQHLFDGRERKGVETIDVASGHKFNMRAMVLWTINDFPARSSLSGWSGQGFVSSSKELNYQMGSDHASSTKLQNYLPDKIAKPIIELCSLFKKILSATLIEDDMLKAQIKVVDILCDLELVYPLALFDIMIHLVIHLPLEALEGGPIHPTGYDDPNIIHFDNSFDLPLSTSLNDLDNATLHIDGQSTKVVALPDIIDTQFNLRPHMESPDWTEIDAGIQQHLEKAYNTNKVAFKAQHWVINTQTGTYNVEKIRRARPEAITAEEWDNMIISRQGSRSLARLRDEMRQSSATQVYPSLIDTFFVAHTVNEVFTQDEDRLIYEEMRRLEATGT
nr:hypothetical protein [Tanacetum cinerariifolium]